MERLAKKSTQIISIAVIAFVIQYFCYVYLARILPASDYGDFVVAISLALLMSVLVDFGASKIVLHYVQLYQNKGDMPHLSGLLRGYILLTLIFSLFIAIVGSVAGYIDVILHHAHSEHGHPSLLNFVHKSNSVELHPLILALWFVPFISLANILASVLKCIRLSVIFELPRLVNFSLLIIFLFVFALFGYKVNDWSGIAFYGVATIVAFVIYVGFAVRYVPLSYVKYTPRYQWREWLTLAFPIMASHLFFLVLKQVDLYMVEIMDADEAQVGYFSAASETAQAIIFFYINLNLIYIPVIVKAILEGKAAVKKTLRKMAGLLTCFSMVFLLVLLFFGKAILALFGQDYVQAYPTMLCLAVGLCSNVICGGYITYLQYSANQNLVVAVQFVILILALILNALLIPDYGILGAGLSSAICFVIMSGFLTFCALRLLYKASS